jgi:cytochrome c biogenesis protein
MSAAEEVLQAKRVSSVARAPVLQRFLDYISSVRFGIILLCSLVILSIIGMLVMQQNVEGFDAYYVSLTPAEKVVFGRLGIFDIYHTWYYNFLLLILSLNIVLASIDRFPSAWSYIVKPKLHASRDWLLHRHRNFKIKAESGDAKTIANAIASVFKNNGFSAKISEKGGAVFVFGESGRWNRLGAYIVHVFLLTLFIGYFVALQTGFDALVRLAPGEKTNRIELLAFDLDRRLQFDVQVPFTIECTDIQQKLINPEGEIDTSNTMDWRTEVRIDDPGYGVNTYEVSLNKPLSYRGYRFFQSQADRLGSARKITLNLIPQDGDAAYSVEIPRGGKTTLADGTKVQFADFEPDFVLDQSGNPATRSTDYNRPAAILNVIPAGGTQTRIYAFESEFADKIPIGAPKLGYKWRLAGFEKAPFSHTLSIKYDPYNASFIAWYIGGFGLVASLGFVFFVSHRRVWASIEPASDGEGHDIVIGGESNRNQAAFDDRFDRIVNALKSPEA